VNYVFILAEIEIYLLGNHIAIKLLQDIRMEEHGLKFNVPYPHLLEAGV
jgi:hypothetical protein